MLYNPIFKLAFLDCPDHAAGFIPAAIPAVAARDVETNSRRLILMVVDFDVETKGNENEREKQDSLPLLYHRRPLSPAPDSVRRPLSLTPDPGGVCFRIPLPPAPSPGVGRGAYVSI